jgi:hypothetical protein
VAFQRHFRSDSLKSSRDVLKEMCLDITKHLILTSHSTTDMRALRSWGAEVESFGAFVALYQKPGSELFDEVKKIRDELKGLSEVDWKQPRFRDKIFKLYIDWLCLISRSLSKFKVYPPMPVTYAQRLGEKIDA